MALIAAFYVPPIMSVQHPIHHSVPPTMQSYKYNHPVLYTRLSLHCGKSNWGILQLSNQGEIHMYAPQQILAAIPLPHSSHSRGRLRLPKL